jgi:hypothetical protein
VIVLGPRQRSVARRVRAAATESRPAWSLLYAGRLEICERAKAEQVLFDLAGIMSADVGSADALDQRYASERRTELLLHDRRARSVAERRMDDAAGIAKRDKSPLVHG